MRFRPAEDEARDLQFNMTVPAMNVFPNPVGNATNVLSRKQLAMISNW